MNTKHQVLNRKTNLFILLKPNICKCKNKKKTIHTKVHITEILQSGHDRKTGHACDMTRKGYILINLGQFEDETSQTTCKFKVFE